ncbi:hypothetical protein [Lysinibacillus antri]|uniref:Uncharacterized protein n=1 Tax=Lysinibacillus antri TaxID=2498145 RepID=A0A3S0R5Q7_9BACI|nr:hypothetical protein [Lysinibacillus antri]RUL51305.1 hypothetical protein EK386_12540 [Lysinibacillus antri]
MKLKHYKEEIIWLLKAMAKGKTTEDVLSFWSALVELQTPKVEKKPVHHSRKRVTVIGEPHIVYANTDLFDQLPEKDKAVLLTSDEQTHLSIAQWSSHPFIKWVDVLYLPPACIKEHLNQFESATLLIDDKLPFWSRSLFSDNRIANLVGTKSINLPAAYQTIRVVHSKEFIYDVLLDDVIATPITTTRFNRIPTELPKDFITKMYLQENNLEQKRITLMDEAAMNMINTYWLANNPNIESWLPTLLEAIERLLSIRKSCHESPEHIISMMRTWGEELTHVNGA